MLNNRQLNKLNNFKNNNPKSILDFIIFFFKNAILSILIKFVVCFILLVVSMILVIATFNYKTGSDILVYILWALMLYLLYSMYKSFYFDRFLYKEAFLYLKKDNIEPIKKEEREEKEEIKYIKPKTKKEKILQDLENF